MTEQSNPRTEYLNNSNALLREIEQKVDIVTPTTPEDIGLFQAAINSEITAGRFTYGNSWTYITQGMFGIGPHNLGYKITGDNFVAAFAAHPHMQNRSLTPLYIVRPMGDGAIQGILELREQLRRGGNRGPIYVKKIFHDQYGALINNGFKDARELPWHEDAPAEDDSLPEQIIDLHKLFSGFENGEITGDLAKYYRRYLRANNTKVVELKEDNRDIAWKVAVDFFQEQRNLGNPLMLSNEYEYYNMIYNQMNPKGIIGRIIYANGMPSAIFIGEKHTEDYGGLYATITHRHKPELKGIMEYTMFEAFKTMHQTGIQHLNLGGSEYQSIQYAKTKYEPHFSQQMHWVVSTA